MGPQEPKDVAKNTVRDLSGMVGELAALKGDATPWLTESEYAALCHRLEIFREAPSTHSGEQCFLSSSCHGGNPSACCLASLSTS
jgi:hypothetical protein